MTLRRRVIEITFDDAKGEPELDFSKVVSHNVVHEYEVENARFDEATGQWVVTPWEELLLAEMAKELDVNDVDASEIQRVEFETWEWDNGYFYYSGGRVFPIEGEPFEFTFDACDHILTELAGENEPLGSSNVLIVDLKAQMVSAS